MGWNNIECAAFKKALVGKDTLRFMHLGYPLLRVRANIHFYKDGKDFCLLKKHILQLVGSNKQNTTPYVRDRLEIFHLLGLDNELYDVANYYYEELILQGLIHETPQGVLAGPAPAGDPAYERIRSARKIDTHLTIDPFGALIFGKTFSQPFCLSTSEIQEEMGGDICLPMLPGYVYQATRLEMEINHRNFDFSKCTEESRNQQLKQQNMPPATQGIQLTRDGDSAIWEVYWIPCYVAVEKTLTGLNFKLYRQDGAAMDKLIDLNDGPHKGLREFLIQLLDAKYNSMLQYRLTKTLTIPLKDKNGELEDKVAVDSHGNYRVSLSEEQLQLLATAGEDELREALVVLLEHFGILSTREVGRLVRFSLTAEQKRFCKHLQAQQEATSE